MPLAAACLGRPDPGHCGSCAEVVVDADWIDHLANLFAEHTSDIWYDWSVEQPLPKGACCPSCGSEDLDKDSDILDVWFDSGPCTPQRVMIKTRSISTLRAQINTVGGFTPPCSSRLRRFPAPPYKRVLTREPVVDGQGKKLSKSKKTLRQRRKRFSAQAPN